jgi:uncharacterized protein
MAVPTVQITDIPDTGLSLAYALQPEDIALGVNDAKVQDVLSVSVEMHKAGEVVAVEGLIEGTFLRQCVRCLNEYETFESLPVSVEFRRHDPQRSSQGRTTVSQKSMGHTEAVYEPGEDVYDYSGDELELTAMLREQVILAIPMQPLCDPDCLGLCPVCGQDRNERRCGCPEPMEASPFSALKELRDGLKQKSREKSGPHRN